MHITSLRTKLIATLVPLTILVLGAMTWLAVTKMTSAQQKTAYAQMRNLAAENANDFNAGVQQQVDLSRSLAATLSAYKGHDRDEVLGMIKNLAERYPATAGVYVGYGPGVFDGPKQFAPYWNRLGSDKLTLDPDVSLKDTWYVQTMGSGHEEILEPYVYDGFLMSSYLAPIVRDGKTIGVAGNDGTANGMATRTASIKALKSGYAILVSNGGIFVSSPDKALAGKKTLAQLGREKNNDALVQVAAGVKAGRSGQVETTDPFTGKDVVMSYAPVKTGHWSLITVAPKAEVLASAHTLRWQLLLAGLVGVLLMTAAVVVLAGRVTGPLRAVVARLRTLNDTAVAGLNDGIGALARGDLTVGAHSDVQPLDVRGHDEIAAASTTANELIVQTTASVQGYEDARAALGDLIGQVSASAGSVSAASEEMATTSDEAGRAVGEIAGAVGEVAAGAERQVRMVESARTAADRTSEAADQARELAVQGATASARATEAMAQVRASSVEVTGAIRSLAAKSDEIGGIVQTITGIAEQTNLLALNAAIEAARAGDQGRGFAVVADEVRKLAEESQQAASSISGLIEQIQAETASAVGVVEDGAARSAEGAEIVEGARDAFARIGDAVNEVSARIGEIASATAEVAAVAEQSSASSEQVSASTQETSASTQEIAASAQELARTAEQLAALVQTFTLV
jgi:methyl-accepting chemotaxis protein